MKVKLERYQYDDSLYLPLPDTILDELGWDLDDELEFDISMTEPYTIIVSRKDKT